MTADEKALHVLVEIARCISIAGDALSGDDPRPDQIDEALVEIVSCYLVLRQSLVYRYGRNVTEPHMMCSDKVERLLSAVESRLEEMFPLNY